MGYTLADEEVARAKLQLTSSTISLNNFLTVWKGLPIIIEQSNLDRTINNIWYPKQLEEEDAECVANLVNSYVENYYRYEEEENG